MQETWGLLAPTPRVSMPIQSKASPTWFGRLSAAAAVARPDCRTAGIHEDDPLEVRALVEAATDREGDLLAVGCGVVERDLHVGALQTRQVLPGARRPRQWRGGRDPRRALGRRGLLDVARGRAAGTDEGDDGEERQLARSSGEHHEGIFTQETRWVREDMCARSPGAAT